MNPPLKLFFYLPILTNNNLTLKIYCENIVVEFLRTFYNLYYFSFFHFILLHTRVQRARGEKKCWVRLSKGQSRRRSVFTMQHYHVRRPTAARPPPHHQVGLDRLFFFFYIYICLLCEEQQRDSMRKKRNPEERERIDIIVAGMIFY